MTTLSLTGCQSAMTRYLLDPARSDGDDLAALMQGTGKTEAVEATKERLRIYRNNVLYSLTQAMKDQFPVTLKVVGDTFFQALARDYVTSHPPVDPSLTFIGQDFPDFIRASNHCRPLPWLGDLARLEWLCQYALHAADEGHLVRHDLATVSPDLLPDAIPVLHTSVQLFSSAFAVFPVWEENLKNEPGVVDLSAHPATRAIVYRLNDLVQVVALTNPVFDFLNAISRDNSISEAWQYSHPNEPEQALPGLLLWLLDLGIFRSLKYKSDKE